MTSEADRSAAGADVDGARLAVLDRPPAGKGVAVV